MKTFLFSSFLILSIFSMAAIAQEGPSKPAPAPSPKPAPTSIAGTWNLSADAGGQVIDITVELKQTDVTFTGSTFSEVGNGTIDSGKITEKAFTATLHADVQGQAVDFKMEGTIDGDTMKGTFSNASFGSVPFAAKRAPKKD